MRHAKDLSLVLAMPLILVGCGSDSEPISVEGNSVETLITSDQIESLSGESAAAFLLDTAEDPVEQIDVINDSIEDMDEVLSETQNTTAESVSNRNFSYDVAYATPKGETPLTVGFVLNNNRITEVSLIGNPQHKTSVQYQNLIQDELNLLVVGQDYETVEALPSKVAGSSLTPEGFNKALEKLQAEA